MGDTLCSVCESIPPHLWTTPWHPGSNAVKMRALDDTELAAEKGCRLCRVIIAALESQRSMTRPGFDFSDPESLITMSKVPFGSAGDLMLNIGAQISVQLMVYRMPEHWGESINLSGMPYLAIPASVEPLSDLVNPINNILLMKQWLTECKKHHSNCSKSSGMSFPSRVLNLEPISKPDDDGIRLITTELVDWNSSSSGYVALSHCWGPPEKHSIKTLKENLSDRLTYISTAELSNTFHDAVEITRQLGFRYLWIDSLCIIQDDKQDWAAEAARMADIYENASCTLAAMSSKDSTGGCCLVTDIQTSTSPFTDLNVVDVDGKLRVRVFIRNPRTWESEFYDRFHDNALHDNSGLPTDPSHELEEAALAENDSPLRFRAWEVSRRIIHFAKNQLLWECRELKATAQLPWPKSQPEEHLLENFDLDLDSVAGAEEVEPQRGEQWHRMVEEFSARAITVGTDKLPALSGLAQRHHRTSLDSQYAAGLWSEHLPEALLWKSLKISSHRSADYIAPSWSWASLQGPVTYKLGRHNHEKHKVEYAEEDTRLVYVYKSSTSGHSKHIQPNGRYSKGGFKEVVRVGPLPLQDNAKPVVTAILTKPQYEDKYGAITTGYLTIENAVIAEVDSILKTDAHSPGIDQLRIDGHGVGIFHRDSIDDDTDGKKALLLRIERDIPCCHFWRGLVLIQAHEDELVYRRVGLARCVDEKVFGDRYTARTVTLV